VARHQPEVWQSRQGANTALVRSCCVYRIVGTYCLADSDSVLPVWQDLHTVNLTHTLA
jgi:hypothetical protein